MSEPAISTVVKQISEIDEQIASIRERILARTDEVIDKLGSNTTTSAVAELKFYSFASKRLALVSSQIGEIVRHGSNGGVAQATPSEFIESLRQAISNPVARGKNGAHPPEVVDAEIVDIDDGPTDLIQTSTRRKYKKRASKVVAKKTAKTASKKTASKSVKAAKEQPRMNGFLRTLEWALGNFNARTPSRYRRAEVSKMLGLSESVVSTSLTKAVNDDIFFRTGGRHNAAYKINRDMLPYAKSLLSSAR